MYTVRCTVYFTVFTYDLKAQVKQKIKNLELAEAAGGARSDTRRLWTECLCAVVARPSGPIRSTKEDIPHSIAEL